MKGLVLFAALWAGGAGLAVAASVGPATGVNAMAVDPVSSTNVYVASPDGLFKSSDAGGNWVLLTNGLPAAPATNVVVVPLSPSTIYAIVGNGVFKSADGGATWGATGQTADAVLAVDPRREGIVYAGGPAVPANLIKSTDGGLHWTPVAIVDTDAQSPGATVVTTVSRMVINPSSPDVLYAAARTTVTTGGTSTDYDKIFKSSTGGAFWQAVAAGNANLAIHPQTSAVYYTVGLTAYISTNGGASWVPSFTTFLSSVSDNTPTHLAFDPQNSALVYVATECCFMIRGGRAGLDASSTPTRFAGATSIVVDPTATDVVYAGSPCGSGGVAIRDCVPLVKSLDAGVTWRSIVAGLREPLLTSIAAVATNPQTVYAGTIETVGGVPKYPV